MKTTTSLKQTLLLLIIFTLSAWNTTAWGGTVTLTVSAQSSPSTGGYVYVNSKKSAPSSYSLANDDATQTGTSIGTSWTGYTTVSKTFYLYASAKAGYSFKGWSKTSSDASGDTSNPKSVSLSGKNSETKTDGPYYAIFGAIKVNSATNPAAISVTEPSIPEVSVTFSVTSGAKASDFNTPTVTGTGWSYVSNSLTVSGTTATLKVKFTATAATPQGENKGTVKLTSKESGGSNKSATVIANVDLKPTLSADPTSLDFGMFTVNVDEKMSKTVTLSFNANAVSFEKTADIDIAPFSATLSGDHKTLTVYYEPKAVGTGTYNASLVVTAKNGQTSQLTASQTISLTGKAQAITYAEYTCKIKDSYMVDDSELDLQDLWKSTSDGAITYSIEKFTPSGNNNSDATAPAISEDNRYLSLGQAGEVQLKLTQKAATSYYAGFDTKTITINKHTTSFSGSAYNNMKVDGTQIADYKYTNTSAEKPTDNSSNDFYYTIDDVKFTNSEKNKGTDLVTFNPTDKKITAYNAGTAKITLHQKETYKCSAAEASFEVAVSKYDNAFTCSWGSWTKKVNFDEVVPVEFTTNNNDYTNSPIEISQTSGKTIATLTKNDNTHYTITASYTRDDATWHLSQAENYKYKACEADAKVQVRVLSAVDCYMFEDNSEHSFSTKITDFSGHFDPAIAVSGPVKQIWFDAKKEKWTAVSNFLVQYSVDNGANWRTIAEDIDLSTSYETYGPYNFPGLQDNERVSHIRFGAATGATYAKYYTNIKISRTTSIKPEDEDGNLVETLTMPQNTVGGSTTAKFYMNYSTCDDVVKIVSNDSHFTVNLPEISVDHSKDFNRAEITITYSSETRGTHTGTITIYTKYQNRTFTVTGTTDKKVQTLTWKNGFTDDPLTLPVGLTVDNKNIAVEASSEKSVMYESSNDKVIKITWGGLGFEVVGVGTATLKASEAGDDYWFPVSESKTVNVTDKKIQVIVWNQDLMSDLALNQVVDLDAKVYLRDMETGTLTYSEVRTPYITYSCPNNSVISVAGNKMTIKGYGETSVTAVVPEATGYEESLPVTLTVKVHEPSTGCTTPNVLNHADNVQLFSMDMDLSNYNTPEITSAPILLNAANGKPDKLSYKHNGELYTVPGGIGSLAIKLCRGTVKAQQRVNGVWSDISGSAFDNEGKDGSKGAYDWRTVENLQLDENADAIRFVRLTDGQGYHNFKDIKISLLQYLRPTKEVVDLGDIEIGEARQAQIGFEYSDVKGEIKAAKTNVEDETYTINEKTIYLTCGSHGHYDLPITVTPTTLGAWSTTITLTDNLTNVSTTLTVKAKVTEGIKYVFNGGEGEGGNVWGSDDNWAENQSNPGKNDAVLINSDVEITGDVKVGSMTIAEGVTVTVTVTGSLTLGSGSSKLLENFGDLHVADGGKVNVGTGTFIVRDFILDAALGNAQGKNASSGQLNDDEGNMYLSRDAYFQISFDPSGQITYGWYDFTVPFEVNITDGIYREGDLEHPLVAGTDFIVMQHSEAARAAGKKDWSVFRGTMLPGRVYTITFDDEVTQNTFLFKKKQGANMAGSADFQAQYTEGSTLTSGWNGLGNGTLHHTQLNDMPSGKKVQLYDHTNNVYVSRVAGSLTYAVGTSFFMQVNGEQTITLSPATSGYGFLAPERTPRATEEFRLALAAEGSETVCDRMWVSANEDATGEYTIDHDLLKMGTPAEAKIAQMWGVRNNTNLCDIEMQMSDDKASCDLGLFAPQAKAYTLSVENGPKDATLYLTHNGEVIWDLSSAPYVFDLAKGTTEGYGLQIQVHNTPQVTTGIDETGASSKSVRKVLIGNQLYIITPEGAMYSVTGTKIQ